MMNLSLGMTLVLGRKHVSWERHPFPCKVCMIQTGPNVLTRWPCAAPRVNRIPTHARSSDSSEKGSGKTTHGRLSPQPWEVRHVLRTDLVQGYPSKGRCRSYKPARCATNMIKERKTNRPSATHQ